MEPRSEPEGDEAERRIVLHGIGWDEYDAILTALGDSSSVRLAYLDGELEIKSPSTLHEVRKKNLARLLESYATERDVPLVGYGSTTFRQKAKKRGVEPDECYILSDDVDDEPTRPDLAIEVVLSQWDLDKFSIYGGLGVKELWLVRRVDFEIWRLRGSSYRRAKKSRLLPDLDLSLLLRFLDRKDQTRATREFLQALRRS